MTDNGNGKDDPTTYGPIFQKVVEFFKDDGWPFEQLEDEEILRLEYEGENSKWRCFAHVIEESQRFVFLSSLANFVPKLMRLEASEYLTRANFGMEVGNFEMDFSDGTVRYRTSVDVEGGELTSVMIKNMVYLNIAVMDQYLPGLKKVVKDGFEPEKAIEEVEAEDREETGEE
ncbi:MAG TPA: YbjN domain-containing protein [Anaerolineaceae bacterium]